jgi:hypothetical protein
MLDHNSDMCWHTIHNIQATTKDKNGDTKFESEMWIWLKCRQSMLCIYYYWTKSGELSPSKKIK